MNWIYFGGGDLRNGEGTKREEKERGKKGREKTERGKDREGENKRSPSPPFPFFLAFLFFTSSPACKYCTFFNSLHIYEKLIPDHDFKLFSEL